MLERSSIQMGTPLCCRCCPVQLLCPPHSNKWGPKCPCRTLQIIRWPTYLPLANRAPSATLPYHSTPSPPTSASTPASPFRSWLQDSLAAAGEFLASGPWEDGGQERTSSSGRAERRRPTLAQLQEVEEEEGEAQTAVSLRAEGEGAAEGASASPFGQPATRGEAEAAQAEGQRQLDVEEEAEEQEEEGQEERKEVEEVRPSLGARLSRPSGPSR